jgi:hypothetical protein
MDEHIYGVLGLGIIRLYLSRPNRPGTAAQGSEKSVGSAGRSDIVQSQVIARRAAEGGPTKQSFFRLLRSP